MSIELKQAAQDAAEAIDWLLKNIRLDAPHLSGKAMGNAEKCASALRTALQQAEAKTDEPVQADSSGPLRVIASLGAALRRLSFAAQTTGGTGGPDAELRSAIGQAEQALSLGGIGQAMFATPEPVLFIHPSTFAMNNSHVGAWKPGHELPGYIPLYTNPAPSVRDDVVRDADRYRWLRKTQFIWGDLRCISGVYPTVVGLEFRWFHSQAQKPAREDLDAAIDAAMQASKEGGAA